MALIVLAGVICGMSLWAFAAFGADKRRAGRGGARTAERRLLALALLGGWPGAKLAQRHYRHKTRKTPFGTLLNLCLAGPLVLLAVALLLAKDPPLMRQVWRAGVVGGGLSPGD